MYTFPFRGSCRLARSKRLTRNILSFYMHLSNLEELATTAVQLLKMGGNSIRTSMPGSEREIYIDPQTAESCDRTHLLDPAIELSTHRPRIIAACVSGRIMLQSHGRRREPF